MTKKSSIRTQPKRTGVSLILASAFMLLLLIPTVSPVAGDEDTVHGLRQAGWQLVEKTARDEWLPGVAPYENLGTLNYVVTYTLQKKGETRVCTLARDNMRDTFTQSCGVAK